MRRSHIATRNYHTILPLVASPLLHVETNWVCILRFCWVSHIQRSTTFHSLPHPHSLHGLVVHHTQRVPRDPSGPSRGPYWPMPTNAARTILDEWFEGCTIDPATISAVMAYPRKSSLPFGYDDAGETEVKRSIGIPNLHHL